MRLFALALVLPLTLYGYSDSDIDGVADSLDRCPNTPFEVLVDATGCDLNRTDWGRLTLQLDAERLVASSQDRLLTYNLTLNYTYQQWGVGVSTTRYDSTSSEEALYLATHYTQRRESLTTQLLVGVKYYTDGTLSQDNDYYTTLTLDYHPTQHANLFGSYTYTYSPSSTTHHLNTTSVGVGYPLLPSWYSSLSYTTSESQEEESDPYQALTLESLYQLSSHTTLSTRYSYTLAGSDYHHRFLVGIGVSFE